MGGGGKILDEIDRYDFCVSVLCSLHPISHFEIEKETEGNVLKTNNIRE